MTGDDRLGPGEIDSESPFTLPGFFDAMAEGELLAARCTDCGTRLLPPRPACYECGSRAVEIEAQPTRGTIVSYTAVNRPPSPFAEIAPITVAIVELDSGARLTGRIAADHDDVAIGDTVEFTVETLEEAGIDPAVDLSYEAGWPVHVFEPVSE